MTVENSTVIAVLSCLNRIHLHRDAAELEKDDHVAKKQRQKRDSRQTVSLVLSYSTMRRTAMTDPVYVVPVTAMPIRSFTA